MRFEIHRKDTAKRVCDRSAVARLKNVLKTENNMRRRQSVSAIASDRHVNCSRSSRRIGFRIHILATKKRRRLPSLQIIFKRSLLQPELSFFLYVSNLL